MVCRVAARGAFLIGSVLSGLLLLGAAPAWAADPSGVTVQGPGISGTLNLDAKAQSEQFQTVLNLVGWMATGPGDPMDLDPDTLGPKYTINVIVGGQAAQHYELYPMAHGGPRAFRPARQPNGTNGSDAWFYVSVMSPGQLATAGVPVASDSTEVLIPVSAARDSHAVPMSRAKAVFLINYAACVTLGVLLTAALAAVTRRISRLGL